MAQNMKRHARRYLRALALASMPHRVFLIRLAEGLAVIPAQQRLVASTARAQPGKQRGPLLRQRHVTWLAGFALLNVDLARAGIKVTYPQLSEFAVAATRYKRSFHQWPKLEIACVHKALAFGDA